MRLLIEVVSNDRKAELGSNENSIAIELILIPESHILPVGKRNEFHRSVQIELESFNEARLRLRLLIHESVSKHYLLSLKPVIYFDVLGSIVAE